MPQPVVEPSPPLRELRFSAPDEEYETSYLAASARISSFCRVSSIRALSNILYLFSLGRKVKFKLKRPPEWE